MGDTKSLAGKEAIEKIREIANGKICLFCTYERNEIVSRPMSTQRVDDDGTIWFFSPRDSEKNLQVSQENKVYLMYLDDGKQHYLSLTGKAEIVTDRHKTEELWNNMMKAWFKEGKDDPQLTLIKVEPQSGHYWDTRLGKLASMLSIAVAVVTGNRDNSGVEGDITV